MKRQKSTKILGTLCLCFALAGGISVATVSANAAEAQGVVSIQNGKLYIDNTEVTENSARFTTSHTAAVRYDPTTVVVDGIEYKQTGMRFFSWIDDTIYSQLMASEEYNVSFGTIIANETSVAAATEFTKEALPNTDSTKLHIDVPAEKFIAEADEMSEQENVTEFSAIVYGIGEENYTTPRMARAYMTVTSITDAEQSVTIYANRTEGDDGVKARSVADVAYRALASSDYDDVSDDQYGALNTYAKVHDSWLATESEKGKTYNYMSFVDSLAELQRFAAYENMYIKAVRDIDLSNAVWTPSNGSAAASNAALTPSCVVPALSADLDGNGKKMYGLTLTETLKDANGKDYSFNIGFFGTITGTVENLIFKGELGAYDTIACPIEGCTATTSAVAPIVRQRSGLFAWNNEGTIKNCYITGKIYNVVTALSTIQASVGTVYQNKGTIENVMTDIKFIRGKSEGGHTCETEEENRYGFALAVSNTGTVANCVTVMSQYTTKIDSNGVRMWTTTELDTNAWHTSSNPYTWQTNAWNANTNGSLVYARTPYGTGEFYLEDSHFDYRRSNCYVFGDYEDLISDTGIGYNDDNKARLGPSTKGTSVYTQKTGADGKSALGEAWSFADGKITLCGTVVWEQTA